MRAARIDNFKSRRSSRQACIARTLMAFVLLLCSAGPAWSAARPELPPESMKELPAVPEKSVSTYINCSDESVGRIAVTISYPTMPRYKSGAPIVVLLPGHGKASGLRFSIRAAQSGFAEVRFAFPGGGLTKFHTGGSWDERGKISQTVLKDVLVFASGHTADYQGKTIKALVTTRLEASNFGIVAWHDSANIALVTLARFADELPFIRWMAFYESPVGSLLSPSILGTAKELFINQHYRQGSAATGRCLIDYRKLAWQPGIRRNRAARLKHGLPTPDGVLFFDENDNGTWEELSEFPLSYAVDPKIQKQFYAPEVTAALARLNTFGTINVDVKTKDGEVVGTRKEKYWPMQVASLKESEEYFQERDGTLYLDQIGKSFTNCLVTVFAGRIDHNEQQPDHPHVALLYNLLLASDIKWVRLNPDNHYVGFIADMNKDNFVDNKPRMPIDATNIDKHLEPEGLIPDHVYMQATIAELADRTHHKVYSHPLEGVLENYLNEARLKRLLEETPPKPRSESAK
ncbi:MAG: hypothetical protein AB7W16_25735 [Candidatus Obscuribacterales bacterium]